MLELAIVMHLLVSGDIGGIEILVKEYSLKSKLNNVFVFVLRGGEIADYMFNIGQQVYVLDGSSKKPLSTYSKIKKIYTKYNINTVVVHHDSPLLHLYATWLKKNNSAILVDYIHRNPTDYFHKFGLLSSMKNRWILNSFLCADKVIAISDFVKNQAIEEFHISSDKIQVIYNGVNIDKFINDNSQHNMNNLIYVGRLEKGKGVQIIIEALSLIKNETEFHLSVVGDGSYRSELEKLTVKKGISDKVAFLGMRNNVQEYMKKAGIFIFTPMWEEGFGITVVEAMASGLICVGSKSGAITEIICDSENGYLINKGLPNQLANTICLIMRQSKDIIKKIRNNGIKTAYRFNIDRYSNELDDLINNNT